jgi:citrate synthase
MLFETVERLAPGIYSREKATDKPLCANVDMYSGFVYKMLGIPQDLYTPLFAIARMPGWCAHRIEEVWGGGKIIRPAYKAISLDEAYVPLAMR